MKNQKLIFIILLLSAGFLTAKAQDTTQVSKPAMFKVHSVNITPGWYQPSMDYWNDSYLPTVGVSEEFGGNFNVGGNITFELPANFRARVDVSYWSDKTEGNSSSAINSLKIGFTRFSLAAIYVPEVVLFNGFQPYLGAEGRFYLIKNKLDNGTTTTDQQGQDYSFAPLIGIERPFNHLSLGIEFLYNIGNYTQDVSDGIGVSKHKVSIAGSEVNLSIGYRF